MVEKGKLQARILELHRPGRKSRFCYRLHCGVVGGHESHHLRSFHLLTWKRGHSYLLMGPSCGPGATSFINTVSVGVIVTILMNFTISIIVIIAVNFTVPTSVSIIVVIVMNFTITTSISIIVMNFTITTSISIIVMNFTSSVTSSSSSHDTSMTIIPIVTLTWWVMTMDKCRAIICGFLMQTKGLNKLYFYFLRGNMRKEQAEHKSFGKKFDLCLQ
ncbi:uncharacterized protein LOC118881846 isoform X2 [Balaenoptera musculus]|uniref:Uncharacterized protein LOC118881846 isoform X2 n=1 Tax=Balaenoptera musculus TaxID=9771 RepID=A0A8B8VDP6_BALMU|nr:uncharacterized protein LOC118881846 isoform X2 [Balaenoptera musculus]